MMTETFWAIDEPVHQLPFHRIHAFAVEETVHAGDRQPLPEKTHEQSHELPEMERGQIRHRHLSK